jgi:hypothetical protein
MLATMETPIAERGDCGIDAIREFTIRQEIDIQRGADYLMRSERNAANQGKSRADSIQRYDNLFDLPAKSGYRRHFKMPLPFLSLQTPSFVHLS